MGRYFPAMRGLRKWILLTVCFAAVAHADAATGRVIKVLPQFLDLKGRASISPSLYDRDAYQAQLRQHPKQRSAMRFVVQWKAKPRTLTGLKLRVELRGIAEGNEPRQTMLETNVTAGRFSKWTNLLLSGEAYRTFGEVTAWRATLWDGDQLLGEQKSFLW